MRRTPLHPAGPARRAGRCGRPANRTPYCTSTTTLKNRIAAFSAAVAPSTTFHSPSKVATSFTLDIFNRYNSECPRRKSMTFIVRTPA